MGVAAAGAGNPHVSPPATTGYLLVVEKDAVFQRLAEDRIWEHREWQGIGSRALLGGGARDTVA